MPSRNTKFFDDTSSKSEGQPIFGRYTTSLWKTWGNKLQEDELEQKIGRRYNPNDDECIKRNMLITVVSNEEDSQLLLEVIALTFGAVTLKTSLLLATCMTLFGMYTF
jgi:hypothetical protein